MTPEELRKVEEIVNGQVRANHEADTRLIAQAFSETNCVSRVHS